MTTDRAGKAMSAATFDTLQYAKKLKAADVPEQQAEVAAEALREAFDARDKAFAEVQAQVQVLTADAKRDAEQRASKGDIHKLDSKIDLFHKELDAKINLVRKDMEALENRLVIKLGKMFVIGVGLILGAIGLAVRYLAH